jgi:hypothetical protein
MTPVMLRVRRLLGPPVSRATDSRRCLVCHKPLPGRTGPLCGQCRSIFTPPGATPGMTTEG